MSQLAELCKIVGATTGSLRLTYLAVDVNASCEYSMITSLLLLLCASRSPRTGGVMFTYHFEIEKHIQREDITVSQKHLPEAYQTMWTRLRGRP